MDAREPQLQEYEINASQLARTYQSKRLQGLNSSQAFEHSITPEDKVYRWLRGGKRLVASTQGSSAFAENPRLRLLFCHVVAPAI